jgi:hypothetical protein
LISRKDLAVDGDGPFHYWPRCSAVACREPAIYKIAAVWSDGSSRELKNYGLACALHRDLELARARRRHQGLARPDEESLGLIELYLLRPGCRDAELTPIREPAGKDDDESH